MTARNLLIVLCFALLSGCGSGDFNYGKVANAIAVNPVRLDAEYVMLTPQSVDCGVQNDLWDVPAGGGGRTIARLKDKGRDLKFSDDVSMGDMKAPYVQIRGEFTLVPLDVQSDRQGPDPETKLVDVKLAVPINHSCFSQPLPLMGVRKGNFSQDYPPVLLFKNTSNGWSIDKIVH